MTGRRSWDVASKACELILYNSSRESKSHPQRPGPESACPMCMPNRFQVTSSWVVSNFLYFVTVVETLCDSGGREALVVVQAV